MIIVKLSGGLGNQMFEYAFGLAQAARHSTELTVDASAYKALGGSRSFGLDGFAISARQATAADWRRIGIPDWSLTDPIARARRKIFRMMDEKKPVPLRKVFMEPSYSYASDAERIGKDTLLIGNWQSERYFHAASGAVRREFSVRSWSKLGTAFKKRIEARTGGTPVSVHIRRGDYAHDTKAAEKHGVLPIGYYMRAASAIAERAQNPVFYVFSDDIEWCKANLSFLAPMAIVSDPDLSLNEEIALMCLADHHIIANSTFSWWGAWLDAKPGATVVAPKQWFRASIDSKDLLPERWLKL